MYDYTNITAQTIPQAHKRSVYNVWHFGKECIDERGDSIRELLNMVIRIPTKDCSHVSGFERLDNDFKNGILNKEEAKKKGESFVYAYGARAHQDKQLDETIQELIDHPTTRRAFIPIYQPQDNDGREDVPCWTSLQLLLRENHLHLTDYFRSNDMYYAFPSDAFGARSLQHYVADRIGSEVGTFTHVIGSAHIRMTDQDAVKSFLKV